MAVIWKAFESLHEQFPAESKYQRDLATALHRLGFLLHFKKGEVEEPDALYAQAIELRQELAEQFASVPDYRRRLVESQDLRAILMSQNDRGQEAIKAMEQAIKVLRQLAADFPAVPDYKSDLGAELHNLAVVVQNEGQQDREQQERARGLFEQAIDHQRAALAANPRRTQYRQFLSNHYQGLGVVLAGLGEYVEAAEAAEELVRISPEGWQQSFDAASVLARCIPLAEHDPTVPEADRAALAQGYFDRANELLREALERLPDDVAAHYEVAWFLVTCPDHRFHDPARALQLAEKVVAAAPRGALYWRTLGIARYRVGDWTGAIEALEKSMKVGFGGDGNDWFFIAMSHWQLGDADAARSWYERAVEWMEINFPDDEDLVVFRAEAEELMGLETAPTRPQGPAR